MVEILRPLLYPRQPIKFFVLLLLLKGSYNLVAIYNFWKSYTKRDRNFWIGLKHPNSPHKSTSTCVTKYWIHQPSNYIFNKVNGSNKKWKPKEINSKSSSLTTSKNGLRPYLKSSNRNQRMNWTLKYRKPKIQLTKAPQNQKYDTFCTKCQDTSLG